MRPRTVEAAAGDEEDRTHQRPSRLAAQFQCILLRLQESTRFLEDRLRKSVAVRVLVEEFHGAQPRTLGVGGERPGG